MERFGHLTDSAHFTFIMWFEAALLFSLLEILLEGYLLWRQLRHVKSVNSPPDIFKDADAKAFASSKSYEIEVTKFAIFMLVYGIPPGILSLFGMHYGWNKTGWFESEMIHMWIFLFIGSAFEIIYFLPASYYRKFVIDEKYGFNKSTIKLWVTDKLKDFAVEMVIDSVLMTGIMAVYRYLGDMFIVVSLIFLFVLTVVLHTIYPTVILPLFTKLTPLEDGDVKTAVMTLAKETDFNMAEVYVSDDSKRTAKQNAMMFGLFTHKVAIADTLLETASVDDICAVVAHEIGHSKHHHIVKMMFLQQLLFGCGLWAIDKIMKSQAIFASFGFTSEYPFIIGVAIVSKLALPLVKCLMLPFNMLLRRMEYQADAFAAKRNLKIDEALVKLYADNKAMIDPEPLYSAFNDSHPTLYQRVTAIRSIQSKTK